MTSSNLFRTNIPNQFALRIRQMGECSWWIYRHELDQNSQMSHNSRIVFFCSSRSEADEWIENQKEEGTVYMLSGN